ncbi:MAG: tetratricopeptide repeat protein [Candidatus Hydrogenedentes bacterium]|nr:tetratricopeptide repeat protein [Candidatus Hydrogenedentota bacterium]
MDRARAQILFKEADELFRAGNAAAALNRLETLKAEFSCDKNLWYARGRCLIALGRFAEARDVAEHMINDLGVPRGKRLLERIADAENGVAPQPLSEMDLGPPPVPTGAMVRRERSARLRLAALAVIGFAVLASAAFYVQSVNRSNVSLAPLPDDEIRRLRANRAIDRERRAAEERAALLARAKAPTTEPGRVIPPEEWSVAAIDGVPDWKPGVYRDVPCKSNAAYTIDVFVPMAYQERTEEFFPGLLISMPEGRPGFQGFKKYAEQNDIIIVSLNHSSNKTFAYNEYAQELAFNTILPGLRVHPELGFTYGASGGARSNWDCMCRHPQNFAGLIQVVFPRGSECKRPPQGVRVAFLYGDRDFNRKGTEKLCGELWNEGYEVQVRMYSGDHYSNPPENLRVELLDWLVGSARRERGLPHPPP